MNFDFAMLHRRGLLALGGSALVAAAMPRALAQTASSVVKIGVIADQSGPYADNGGPGSALAARMAIEDRGGVVLGKAIQLLVADDQNKPDIGVAAARRWLDADGVDVIVGGSASSIALATQDLMKQHSKPYLLAGTASSELTNSACSPMGQQWVIDTYSLPKATAQTLVKQGKDTWFFVTVDYAFGKQWEADTTRFISQAGGRVVGSVRHPLNTADFSSFLLMAQNSGAKVIALANSGADFNNAVKQAHEFGITQGGQTLAPLGLYINQVHALGLDMAKGLTLTTPFYWDQNEGTRAFAKRFMAAFNGRVPNEAQAGTYSAVTHYLKAVEAAGGTDGPAVVAKMHELPINDFSMKDVRIREDGQVMRPMYLAEVKAKEDSKYPYDYYAIKSTIPAEEAWRPASESVCPLLKRI
ncbi:ABC transporter substrate-binding protein [Methylocapsa sp. S129]|uniref:ABC transporter substrate-binding protein n=1 Tax=Methylocapsa sp. S129 TaxID=1641869 RepID=UPI001FEDD7F6|nr:ABC transporter substrate-binding protein [Methylocapsa sp. S129]